MLNSKRNLRYNVGMRRKVYVDITALRYTSVECLLLWAP